MLLLAGLSNNTLLQPFDSHLKQSSNWNRQHKALRGLLSLQQCVRKLQTELQSAYVYCTKWRDWEARFECSTQTLKSLPRYTTEFSSCFYFHQPTVAEQRGVNGLSCFFVCVLLCKIQILCFRPCRSFPPTILTHCFFKWAYITFIHTFEESHDRHSRDVQL